MCPEARQQPDAPSTTAHSWDELLMLMFCAIFIHARHCVRLPNNFGFISSPEYFARNAMEHPGAFYYFKCAAIFRQSLFPWTHEHQGF